MIHWVNGILPVPNVGFEPEGRNILMVSSGRCFLVAKNTPNLRSLQPRPQMRTVMRHEAPAKGSWYASVVNKDEESAWRLDIGCSNGHV